MTNAAGSPDASNRRISIDDKEKKPRKPLAEVLSDLRREIENMRVNLKRMEANHAEKQEYLEKNAKRLSPRDQKIVAAELGNLKIHIDKQRVGIREKLSEADRLSQQVRRSKPSNKKSSSPSSVPVASVSPSPKSGMATVPIVVLPDRKKPDTPPVPDFTRPADQDEIVALRAAIVADEARIKRIEQLLKMPADRRGALAQELERSEPAVASALERNRAHLDGIPGDDETRTGPEQYVRQLEERLSSIRDERLVLDQIVHGKAPDLLSRVAGMKEKVDYDKTVLSGRERRRRFDRFEEGIRARIAELTAEPDRDPDRETVIRFEQEVLKLLVEKEQKQYLLREKERIFKSREKRDRDKTTLSEEAQKDEDTSLQELEGQIRSSEADGLKILEAKENLADELGWSDAQRDEKSADIIAEIYDRFAKTSAGEKEVEKKKPMSGEDAHEFRVVSPAEELIDLSETLDAIKHDQETLGAEWQVKREREIMDRVAVLEEVLRIPEGQRWRPPVRPEPSEDPAHKVDSLREELGRIRSEIAILESRSRENEIALDERKTNRAALAGNPLLFFANREDVLEKLREEEEHFDGELREVRGRLDALKERVIVLEAEYEAAEKSTQVEQTDTKNTVVPDIEPTPDEPSGQGQAGSRQPGADPETETVARPEKRIYLSTKNLFRETFNMSAEDLEGMDLERLTEGQQRLIVENLRQIAAGRIEELAEKKVSRKDAETVHRFRGMFGGKLLGKFWNSISREYRIADSEKRTAIEIAQGGKAMHGEVLARLVAGMIESGPEAEYNEKTGEVDIRFLSDTGLERGFAGVESGAVASFNETARAFSKIPYEWSLSSASRRERSAYRTARERYEVSLGQVKDVFAASGRTDALSVLGDAEGKIDMMRLLRTHPDIGEHMASLAEQSVLRRAFSKSVRSKGALGGISFALGLAKPSLAAGIFGAVAGPVVPLVVATYGAGIWVAGRVQRKNTERAFIEQDRKARKGERGRPDPFPAAVRHAVSEYLSESDDSARRFFAERGFVPDEARLAYMESYLRNRTGAKDGTSDPVISRAQVWDAINSARVLPASEMDKYRIMAEQRNVQSREPGFVESDRLSSKLRTVIAKCEKGHLEAGAVDPKDAALLGTRIRYTRRKLSEGLIDFGADPAGSIRQKYDLIRALSKAEAVFGVLAVAEGGMIPSGNDNAVSIRLNERTDRHAARIRSHREREMDKQFAFGVAISAGSLIGGRMFRRAVGAGWFLSGDRGTTLSSVGEGGGDQTDGIRIGALARRGGAGLMSIGEVPSGSGLEAKYVTEFPVGDDVSTDPKAAVPPESVPASRPVEVVSAGNRPSVAIPEAEAPKSTAVEEAFKIGNVGNSDIRVYLKGNPSRMDAFANSLNGVRNAVFGNIPNSLGSESVPVGEFLGRLPESSREFAALPEEKREFMRFVSAMYRALRTKTSIPEADADLVLLPSSGDTVDSYFEKVAYALSKKSVSIESLSVSGQNDADVIRFFKEKGVAGR